MSSKVGMRAFSVFRFPFPVLKMPREPFSKDGKRKTENGKRLLLSLINGQESVVESKREHGHRGLIGAVAKAAVGVLRVLEITDGEAVPLLPRLVVALEQGLGCIVAVILRVAALAMLQVGGDMLQRV